MQKTKKLQFTFISILLCFAMIAIPNIFKNQVVESALQLRLPENASVSEYRVGIDSLYAKIEGDFSVYQYFIDHFEQGIIYDLAPNLEYVFSTMESSVASNGGVISLDTLKKASWYAITVTGSLNVTILIALTEDDHCVLYLVH